VTVVWVRWLDAASEASNATHVENLASSGIEAESAGILVRLTDDCLSIAQDVFPEQQGHGEATFRRVLHIPRAYIIEMATWA
jgi:hypothetical protein